MRIGELSRRTGASVRSLRYYEEQGLLLSSRSEGGHRVYSDAAIDRVIRIQELYAAGLRSATIAHVLPCMRDVDGGPNERATPRLVEVLEGERVRIERQIVEMKRTRDVLDEVIANAANSQQREA
jgi:DNA-binding transcriptional MerR regulator